MPHANAPFTPEGRRRLVARVLEDGRAISHVADEANVSRQRLSVWVRRFELLGEEGLVDRSSRPARSPNLLPEHIGDEIERLRRTLKKGPDYISGLLAQQGITVSAATVHRELKRRGINRLRTLDPPTGEDAREVVRYEHLAPGDMIHIDVKKVGKIPDGGGWRVHGRDSEQALKSRRKANKRAGYTYIHAAVDDHSRLAYAECLNDERAVTAVEFYERAAIFFAGHGITIRSVLTDNGSCYISGLWKAAMRDSDVKHRRTRRQTPRTNGKVERFNKTMKDEWLYVRAYSSEIDRRNHLVPFLNEYNHDRPHSSIGNRPPILRAPEPGPRMTSEPIVAPLVDRPGQIALDFSTVNNES